MPEANHKNTNSGSPTDLNEQNTKASAQGSQVIFNEFNFEEFENLDDNSSVGTNTKNLGVFKV